MTGTIRTLRVDKGLDSSRERWEEFFFHQSAVYGEVSTTYAKVTALSSTSAKAQRPRGRMSAVHRRSINVARSLCRN